MEGQKERRLSNALVAILAIAGLTMSCAIGAMAGGAAGWIAAGHVARRVAVRAIDQELAGLPLPVVPGPVPEEGIQPRLPEAPLSAGGALVVEVLPGTPADLAGIQVGDVILAVGGAPIDANHPLQAVLRQFRPGDRAEVRWLRQDQKLAAEVKLAQHPESPQRAYLGVRVPTRPSTAPEGLPDPQD